MKKFILLFLLIESFCGWSQEKEFHLSLGPTAAFPVSNAYFHPYYKNGVGINFNCNYYIFKNSSLQFSNCYFRIKDKDVNLYTTEFNYWLIMMGIRRNLIMGIFGGLHFGGSKYGEGKTKFNMATEIGYALKISKSSAIEFVAKYDYVFKSSFTNQWLIPSFNYRICFR